jgi:cysteine-rich repeat protein
VPGWATALLVLATATTVHAQLSQSEFRAADGTAYQLLRVVPPLSAGAEKVRVTSVVGSSNGVGGCNLTGSMAGQRASAVAGVLSPAQLLHPYAQIQRTAILVPSSVTAVLFDSNNAGRLTIGTGAGAVEVCRLAGDCPGGSAAPLVPLSSSSGGVAPACIANGVMSSCEGSTQRTVFAFGLPNNGASPPVCSSPQNVTASTFLCAAEPSDGFALLPGQAIVLAYNGSLAGMGFEIGSAAFGIDTNGSNPPGCAPGSVVSAAARLDSNPGLPLPTNTPTVTATFTHTPTLTPTFTSTPTVTQTFTNTYTPTATPTPSATPTHTPFCGNGIPETPEQCDDGNNVNGDCCSATCIFEAPGAPCADDGNTCTRDECTGTGTCIHPDQLNGTTCGTGNMCLTGQQCVGGQCVGGEAVNCDDDDECTTDTCEPDLGCLSEIGVESPECGSCEDGIDNDGDGQVDAENPNCATFHQLQRFAIIGTATDGLRSLKLGREARVVEPSPSPTPSGLSARGLQAPPVQNIRAGACGVKWKSSIGVLVTGCVALESTSIWAGGLPEIRVLGCMSTDTPGGATMGQHRPLIGPPSQCTNGQTMCFNDSHCPPGQQCEIQQPLGPGNPWVSEDGTHPEFHRCVNTLAAVPTTDQTISALVQTKHLSQIHLRSGQSGEISLDHGQNVVDIDALRIGQDGGLTLKGFPDTVVVLRIAGAFRIGTRSHVTLSGGIKPDNVLWAIGGAGRFVRISSRCTFPGTLLAAKRAKISIGAFTVIDGSLIGKRIRMGRESMVVHYPFTALLEGPTVDSPNLAVRVAKLRSSIPGRQTGSLRVTAIVDDTSVQTFRAQLAAGNVSFVVDDAGTFLASAALTGCSQTDDRVFRCRSGDTRATIKALRDDPNIYTVTIKRRRLDPAQAGVVPPTGPVLVKMFQGMLEREGAISLCQAQGEFALACRAP